MSPLVSYGDGASYGNFNYGNYYGNYDYGNYYGNYYENNYYGNYDYAYGYGGKYDKSTYVPTDAASVDEKYGRYRVSPYPTTKEYWRYYFNVGLLKRRYGYH